MGLKSNGAIQSGLAQSKIRVPQVPEGLINRERLHRRLDDVVATAGITLLQAPAGYGKTSLLSQWASSRTAEAVAWMTVSSIDDDPTTLLVYLTSALEFTGVTIDDKTKRAVLSKNISRPEIVTQALANCILADSRKILLCMDDVHLLTEKSAIDCVSTLVENTHNNFRIILATRETPSILFGRLRAYGNLAEIGVDQLRFKTPEIVQFFSHSGPHDLSHAEVGLIEERTEGWAAGLRMASVVLTGEQDRGEMLASLTGGRRQLAAFFGEEILSRQPPELQKFLMRTSILDRFCADLCSAVSGVKDAQRWIEECEARGLFIVPLDQCKTWYRYHHLFEQFMRRKVHEHLREELPVLHSAACEWLCGSGLHVEAFEHAMAAGMPERAGEILESQCDNLFAQGKQPTLMRLAARLPDAVRNRLPKVLLSVAWRLIAAWRTHEAEEILAICRERLEELRADPQHDTALVKLIENYILHRELTIAVFRDDVVLAEQYAERLLVQYPRVNPYMKSSIYHDLLDAGRLQFKLSGIDRMAALAREQLDLAASEHALVFHASVKGSAYFLAGRTDEAISALSEGMAVARRLSGHADSLAAVAAMPLSAILYERNDVPGPRALLDRYLGPAASLGLVEQLIAGWITSARLHWLDGAGDKAIRVLKDAHSFADAHGFERLKSAVEAELVRMLLLLGELDEAAAIRPDSDSSQPSDDLMPRKNATLRLSEYASIWVRLALARGRVTESLTVIRHWRRLLESTQAVPVILGWDLLFARSLSLEGKQPEALRVLDQAIAKAQGGRFIRTFLDEGGVIATLLEQLAQKKSSVLPGTTPFCSELLELFRGEQGIRPEAPLTREEQSGILGSMSRRELQVLSLAASRISNREIGETLGLTEGSVKWYLQQVYDKIGVRRRSEAARKARHLGLIT